MNEPTHLSRFWKLVPSGSEWTLTTPDWALVQLSAGSASAVGANVKQELSASQVLVAPPNATLRFQAGSAGAASFRATGIRVNSLSGFLTAIEHRCLETEAAKRLSPFLTVSGNHPIIAGLNGLFTGYSDIGLSCRLGLVQAFAQLLEPQLRGATETRDALEAQGEEHAKDRLVQLLNETPESELATLSLGQFAQRIHVCERHASRIFQEVYGENFRSFASNLRLKVACKLLAERHLKIIDVAFEAGFGSLAQFNYAFKRKMQMTPKVWRKRHLDEASHDCYMQSFDKPTGERIKESVDSTRQNARVGSPCAKLNQKQFKR